MISGTQKILQERSSLKTEHRVPYEPLKRTVPNNINYSGQELLLEISYVRGLSEPFRWTACDTSMHFGKKLCQVHISTTDRPKDK